MPCNGQEIEAGIKKEIKKILKFEVEWKKKLTPGFQVVFIEPDTSFTVNFGTEIGSQEEIEKDRLFSIGGLSKVYSTIAVIHAIQSGELDNSKVATEVFPLLYQSKTFIVTDLIEHKTGMQRVLKGLQVNRKNDFENVSEIELMEALSLNVPKENEFLYNHNDFALLELWVRKETNKSIREWYEEAQLIYEILPPWREEFSPTIGFNDKGRKVNNYEYGVYTSSLGLYATSAELEKLVRFLNAENSISLLMRSNESKTGIARNIKFATGLYKVGNSKKHSLYMHAGKSANNHASIHLVPETNTGVVIVSNSQTGTNPLYLHLISMINHNWKR